MAEKEMSQTEGYWNLIRDSGGDAWDDVADVPGELAAIRGETMTRDSNNPHLVDAVNAIAKYCQEQMPEGWQLSIKFSREEAYCELIDAGGDEHEGWDGNSDPVTDACDYAMHTQVDEQTPDA